MQANKFLHKLLSTPLVKIHKTRINSLTGAVSSLLNHRKLTLTALRHNLAGQALVKQKIIKSR